MHEVENCLIKGSVHESIKNVKNTQKLSIADDIKPAITEVLFENIGEEVVAKICGSRMWFIYNVTIKGIIDGNGKGLKVDVMKSSEFEIQTTMKERNVHTESKVRVRVKTHFQNSKFLPEVEVPAKESVSFF